MAFQNIQLAILRPSISLPPVLFVFKCFHTIKTAKISEYFTLSGKKIKKFFAAGAQM